MSYCNGRPESGRWFLVRLPCVGPCVWRSLTRLPTAHGDLGNPSASARPSRLQPLRSISSRPSGFVAFHWVGANMSCSPVYLQLLNKESNVAITLMNDSDVGRRLLHQVIEREERHSATVRRWKECRSADVSEREKQESDVLIAALQNRTRR